MMMMNKLYHRILRLLRIEPSYVVYRYTFIRQLQFGYISVIQVYRDGRLLKEFNCGDRMKLDFVRGLMTRVIGKDNADSVLSGHVGEAHLCTTKKLFK